MRHTVLLATVLAFAELLPSGARAQQTADSACNYSRCGLRVDHGFLSTRLVRGSSGERVARLGPFGSGVGILLTASDSASHHAREYRNTRQLSDALGIASAALFLLTVWTTDDFVEAPVLLIGAIALEVVSLPMWIKSRRSLDRSVWWYNRELPRP